MVIRKKSTSKGSVVIKSKGDRGSGKTWFELWVNGSIVAQSSDLVSIISQYNCY